MIYSPVIIVDVNVESQRPPKRQQLQYRVKRTKENMFLIVSGNTTKASAVFTKWSGHRVF